MPDLNVAQEAPKKRGRKKNSDAQEQRNHTNFPSQEEAKSYSPSEVVKALLSMKIYSNPDDPKESKEVSQVIRNIINQEKEYVETGFRESHMADLCRKRVINNDYIKKEWLMWALKEAIFGPIPVIYDYKINHQGLDDYEKTAVNKAILLIGNDFDVDSFRKFNIYIKSFSGIKISNEEMSELFMFLTSGKDKIANFLKENKEAFDLYIKKVMGNTLGKDEDIKLIGYILFRGEVKSAKLYVKALKNEIMECDEAKYFFDKLLELYNRTKKYVEKFNHYEYEMGYQNLRSRDGRLIKANKYPELTKFYRLRAYIIDVGVDDIRMRVNECTDEEIKILMQQIEAYYGEKLI